MQIEIIKNLFLFGETTTILFILIKFYFSFVLHLKVNFYFSLYKYIVWLEISTKKLCIWIWKILKKKKKKEKLIESQKQSMDKFFISNKQNITKNLDENITNEQEIHQK